MQGMSTAEVLPPTDLPSGALTAGDVMTIEVVTVTETDSVAAAWELLARGDFHHLPVVRSGHYVGVLDDRALLRAWRPGALTRVRHTVGQFLGPAATGVSPSTPVVELARLLVDRGEDVAAVTADDGRLLGIVTASDLVRVLARQTR